MPYLNRVFVDHRLQIHQGMSQKKTTFKFLILLRWSKENEYHPDESTPSPVQASPF